MNEKSLTKKFELKAPVLFLVFNRPDTTARVFEAIRLAKPKKLYIAADGPRIDRQGEKELCGEVRKIVEQVDWDCKVYKLFRTKNLGCKKAVSSAIDWFFKNEKEGIILEDDCLPHPSFFQFTQELLVKYRNDTNVSMISGDNFQYGWRSSEESYYFSKYCHIWGWASWRRAWEKYDVGIRTFPEFKARKKVESLFFDRFTQRYWLDIMQSVFNNEINTWDYQWMYSTWLEDSLCILPNVNVVSNIGCESGTHFQKKPKGPKVADIPALEMEFPLNHPKIVKRNIGADKRYTKKFIGSHKAGKLFVIAVRFAKRIFNPR